MAAVDPKSAGKLSIKRQNSDKEDDISGQYDALNTRLSMKSAVNVLRKYLTEQGLPTTFEEYDTSDLDFTLAKFYTEARQENGELYRKSSLFALRNGISRHLSNYNIDIVNGDNFKESKEVFKAVCADLKNLGMDTVEHAPCISDDDLKKLYHYFDVTDSTSLQEKVFVDLMLYLLKNKKNRGRYDFRNMKISEFGLGTDAEEGGLGYIFMKSDDSNPPSCKENAMYERPGDKFCPYKSFVSYLEKLDRTCDSLFQRAIKDGKAKTTDTWYDGNPLGHNTLGTMMQSISEKSRLSRRYTNSSLNITSTHLLDSGEIINYTPKADDLIKDIKVEPQDETESNMCDLGLYVPFESFSVTKDSTSEQKEKLNTDEDQDIKSQVKMYVREIFEQHRKEFLKSVKDEIFDEFDRWKKEINSIKNEIKKLSKTQGESHANSPHSVLGKNVEALVPVPTSDSRKIPSILRRFKGRKNQTLLKSPPTKSRKIDESSKTTQMKLSSGSAATSDAINRAVKDIKVEVEPEVAEGIPSPKLQQMTPSSKLPKTQDNTVSQPSSQTFTPKLNTVTLPSAPNFTTAANIANPTVSTIAVPTVSVAQSNAMQTISSSFGSVIIPSPQLSGSSFQQTRMPVSIIQQNIAAPQISYPLGQAMIPPGTSIILRDGQFLNIAQSAVSGNTITSQQIQNSPINLRNSPGQISVQQSSVASSVPVVVHSASPVTQQASTIVHSEPKSAITPSPAVTPTVQSTPAAKVPTSSQHNTSIVQNPSSPSKKSSPSVPATRKYASSVPKSAKDSSSKTNSASEVNKDKTKPIQPKTSEKVDFIDLVGHPAPLPAPPPFSSVDAQGRRKKFQGMLPPKPILKISCNDKGIVLSWNFNRNLILYSEIESYELYSYQEGEKPPDTDLWTMAGQLKALPLPMACTLSHFQPGFKYHFAVRAIDVYNRHCAFSDPVSILLK